MSKNNKLQEQSGSGLTPVESVADIPDALLEAESECSALAKELQAIGAAHPILTPALSVWESRTKIILDRLTDCRRVMTAQKAGAVSA